MIDCPDELKKECDTRIKCLITNKCAKAWQRMWAHTIAGVTSYKLLTMSNAHRTLKVLSRASSRACEVSYGIQRMYLLQLLVFGLITKHGRYYTITSLGLSALEKLEDRMKRGNHRWYGAQHLSHAHQVYGPTTEKQYRVEVAVDVNQMWLEYAKKFYW